MAAWRISISSKQSSSVMAAYQRARDSINNGEKQWRSGSIKHGGGGNLA